MLMDSKKIEALLEKYWKCETSLEEEQLLRQYFQGSQIPERWRETANLFRYFEESKKKTLTDVTFDGEVLTKVRGSSKGKMATLVYNSMRIAAGVAVLTVAFWFVKTDVRKTTPQEIVDTYDDPKLAFEETKKALMMISKSFGTAEEQTRKIDLFNDAQDGIRRKKEVKQNL